MSSFHSVHHPDSESYGGISDVTPGTSVDPGGTTQAGDILIEVSSDHCRVKFNGRLMCLGGQKNRKQGHQKSHSAMEQEPVGTCLAKKTRKGKIIGAITGTKMSPR
jgi:hypothetical protein